MKLNMKSIIMSVLIGGLLYVSLIFAHGDKHNTVTVVNRDTTAVKDVMVNDVLTLAKETVEPDNTEVTEDFKLTAGLTLAVIVELASLRLDLWSYSNLMPNLIFLGIGLSLVLQMLILPISFFQLIKLRTYKK